MCTRAPWSLQSCLALNVRLEPDFLIGSAPSILIRQGLMRLYQSFVCACAAWVLA